MESLRLSINKSSFINKSNSSLTDVYAVIQKLRESPSYKMYEIQHRKTGELRLCKQISKLNIKNYGNLETEIEILKSLDHPHIIKLYEYYETKRSVYLVMEYCRGGDLIQKMIEKTGEGFKIFTENDAASILKDILLGIEYCHKRGICHRDLNPDHILYLHKDTTNDLLKIIDFGLSKFFNESEKLKTKVGSERFMAKEVLEGSYSEKCDIWSAGVILFFLLSGNHPFDGENQNEIITKINAINYDFLPQNKWDNISPEAKDLIRHMIIEEDKRFDATQALAHPWFTKCPNIKNINLHFDSKCFSEYRRADTFKKVVLLFISSRLNDDEVLNLQHLFGQFDKNKDCQITYNEFEQGLLASGHDKTEVEETFKAIDADGSGGIDYTEFLAACLDQKKYLRKEKLFEAFAAFDTDGSGKISKEKIMEVLKTENIKLQNKVDDILKKFGKDNDGSINYKEFVQFIET